MKYSSILGFFLVFCSHTIVIGANTVAFLANTDKSVVVKVVSGDYMITFWVNTVLFFTNTVIFEANMFVFWATIFVFGSTTFIFGLKYSQIWGQYGHIFGNY